MSTTLPHGIIQINEGNISWYGDITANWQLIDSKIGEYDAAVASIPAPANNGVLTINYGGTTIAMFGADDADNVSADIPAPGDGTLTVTYGGSTLGSFSANQATPETIDIPAPGDGTLTIRLNGVDVQTFTANQANDVVADIIPPVPGDGTLTIKVNGSTAGTFTANQSTNATANITVPTAVSELTNDSGYLTSSSNLDASKLTSGTVDIARLPQGALERLVKVANEAARYALTTADVQLGDTVQQLDTGIMYIVTDADHLDSAAGYTEYTAGTAASVPWSGVTGKPTFAAVATSGAYSDLTGTPALAAVATSGAYSDLTGTPTIPTVNNATLTIQKNGTNVQTFTANQSTNATANITVPTKTSDLTNDSGFITSDNTKIPLAGSNAISGSLIPSTDNSIDIGSSTKNIKALYTKGITIDGAQFSPSDYIPRSGGAVLEGQEYKRTVSNSTLNIYGGQGYSYGAFLQLAGRDDAEAGAFNIQAHDGVTNKILNGKADGTLSWGGQPIQTPSDQRLKQQIAEIDDKLLDAWEDVNLVQFKYNDAVDAKGKDKARLHTGYVVQQIDSACKSHGVDVSEYGLYCHEEYPEETEEVEVEQADGTKAKERKVIREANEHYSLRYTEALIVECKYLRRCIARLTARIEQLEKEPEASK